MGHRLLPLRGDLRFGLGQTGGQRRIHFATLGIALDFQVIAGFGSNLLGVFLGIIECLGIGRNGRVRLKLEAWAASRSSSLRSSSR